MQYRIILSALFIYVVTCSTTCSRYMALVRIVNNSDDTIVCVRDEYKGNTISGPICGNAWSSLETPVSGRQLLEDIVARPRYFPVIFPHSGSFAFPLPWHGKKDWNKMIKNEKFAVHVFSLAKLRTVANMKDAKLAVLQVDMKYIMAHDSAIVYETGGRQVFE